MGNCITLEDTNGNRKLLKKRYDQKIDAVAAMMDAYIAYKSNKDAFEQEERVWLAKLKENAKLKARAKEDGNN